MRCGVAAAGPDQRAARPAGATTAPLSNAADVPAATPFASVAAGPPLSGVGKAATEEEGMTVLEVSHTAHGHSRPRFSHTRSQFAAACECNVVM